MYQNKQWIVTDVGVTSIVPYSPQTLVVLATEFLEVDPNIPELYKCLYDVLLKDWCEPSLFRRVIDAAALQHAEIMGGSFNSYILDNTFRSKIFGRNAGFSLGNRDRYLFSAGGW